MGGKTGTYGSRQQRAFLWGAGLLGTAFAYFATFMITRDQPLAFHIEAVARNVISLAISVWLVRALLVRWSLASAEARFWVVHTGLSVLFTLVWAWLLNLTDGLIGSGSAIRFSVSPVLAGSAITWQLLQGLFVYVAIAAVTILEHRPAGVVVMLHEAERHPPGQFLVKQSDELIALDIGDIISIRGAGDYSELTTATGNHLVQTALQEFEQLLIRGRFVRVHRSAIANLDYVRGAEPSGGGRMILHMREGPDLPVSRAGAKLLRETAL